MRDRSGYVSSLRLYQVPQYTHGNQRRLNIPIPFTVEFMEWLGYWWGDGWIENERDVGIIVGDKDPDVFEILITRSNEWFGKANHRPQRRGSREFKVSSVVLVRWMRDLKCEKTKLPKWLYELDEVRQQAFLRGLFEADGCVWVKTISRKRQVHLFVTMKSRDVIEGVAAMLRMNGIGCRVRETTRGYWNVRVEAGSRKLFQERIGFLGKRKRDTMSKITGASTI